MHRNILLVVVILMVFVGGAYLLTVPGEMRDSKQGLDGEEVKTEAYSSESSTTGAVVLERGATTTVISTIKNNMHYITLNTNLGVIKFQTYDADAPKTVQNFITLANKGFYNGVIFHRVIKNFMIQGGDPTGTGMGGPGYQFEDELNSATPSYKEGYKKGVVAMANAGPNTNGSQFFIMLADTPLPNAYTIFGKVVAGQEVVDAIGDVQTGPQDRPVTPVTINSVVVEEVK